LREAKGSAQEADRFPIKGKTGCLSGKGMNESFKDEDKNIVKDEDLTPDFSGMSLRNVTLIRVQNIMKAFRE